MSDFWPKLIWVFAILLFLLSLVGSPLEAGYEDLETKLEAGERVDKDFLSNLSSPSTPRQYWLYARATTSVDESLEMLRQAVEEAPELAREIKYFSDWLEVALISSRGDKAFLQNKLEQFFNEPQRAGGEFWLEAGRLSEQLQYLEGADKSYQVALEVDPELVEAQLYRARVKLQQGELAEARELLRNYFLEPGNGVKSLYWILQGRAFEQQGADTEAYVAYSHVVNHYPESMLLSQAEERMREIPLPEEFYAEDISPDQIEKMTGAGAEDGMEIGDPADEEPAFRVQVGAFQKREAAENLAADVSDQTEVDVFIYEAEVEGTLYYRVQVGAKEARTEVEGLKAELAELGYEGFVVHQ